MHELGMLRSAVAATVRGATKAGATGVEAVGLRVGSLSGAVPEALRGAWPIATAGTLVEGARLDIEVVQAAVWCPTCACAREINEFYAWRCPVCATPTAALARGREFDVAYADLLGTG